MGQIWDALTGRDIAAARAADRPAAAAVPAVEAAAGRVALAQRGPTTRGLPVAVGGDNLLPIGPADLGYTGLWGRDAAMSLPTVKRARDLIVTAVSQLPITHATVDFSSVPAVESQTPPRSWAQRPDPSRTRQWMLAWTADDLYFYGLSHWRITGRYADTFPSRFERLLPGDLFVDDRTGRVTVRAEEIDPVDVVEFLSPIDGLLDAGYRAVSIALQLDDAAERFAATEVPAGWLQEREGGEPLSPDDLGAAAATVARARRDNTIAAIGQLFDYQEANYDPSRMQLVEGRTYQALELSRLGNVPPYLVGAPAGTGMTYLNAEQAKADLIDFGALPYIACIEQTLSGPNVLPRGTITRLDVNAWLRNPFTTTGPGGTAEPSPNDMQIAFDQPASTPAVPA